MHIIEKIVTMSAGTKARTVMVNGLTCLVQNNSGTDVYFKEKRADGVDVTAENGWRLGPGESTVWPMAVRELSVAAGKEDADVRVLILEEY